VCFGTATKRLMIRADCNKKRRSCKSRNDYVFSYSWRNNSSLVNG
jgi:hypothetical protein